jgi:hypothetical protein
MEHDREDHEHDELAPRREVVVARYPYDKGGSSGCRRDQSEGACRDDPATEPKRESPDDELLDRQQHHDERKKVRGEKYPDRSETLFSEASPTNELVCVSTESRNEAAKNDVERSVTA